MLQAIDLLPHIVDEAAEEALGLQIYTLQGLALTQARGFGDASVNEAYSRAWSICQAMHKTGKPEFVAVWGIWAHKLVVSDTHIGRELTHTLEAISAQVGESDLLMLSSAARIVTSFCTGEFTRIEDDLAAVMEGYDLVQHANLALSYSMDPKALSLLFASHGYAALGDLRKADWARAEAVNHITGLGMDFLQPYANIFGLGSSIYYGADEKTLMTLDTYIAMASELGLPFWMLAGNLWKGAALAQMDLHQEAEAILRVALQQADAGGLSLTVAYQRSMFAKSLDALGKHEEAAAAFERSIDNSSTMGEVCSLPEIRRLYGSCLMRRGDVEGAAAQFNRGLTLAQIQQAMGWEGRLLRTVRTFEMGSLLAPEVMTDFAQRLRASPLVEQDWGQALLAEI